MRRAYRNRSPCLRIQRETAGRVINISLTRCPRRAGQQQQSSLLSFSLANIERERERELANLMGKEAGEEETPQYHIQIGIRERDREDRMNRGQGCEWGGSWGGSRRGTPSQRECRA